MLFSALFWVFPRNEAVTSLKGLYAIDENTAGFYMIEALCFSSPVPCFRRHSLKRPSQVAIMASQLDAWWSCSYPRFSIRDLSRLPIYHRFLQLHYPYEREDKDHSETFHCSDTQDSFQWIEQGRRESFTHEKAKDEYHYETEYPEKNYRIRVDSWTSREAEWGSIVKTYPQWELKEAWRSEGLDKTYERLTIEQGLKRGFKCGITIRAGEIERWVEEIWDQPEENVSRKSWERPGSSGGESRTQKGDYTWGEEWLSDSIQEKKKCWHEENGHKWGYASGKKGRQESWEHQWDLDSLLRFEESLSFDGARASGYRYSQQGEDWYKQEWQGPGTIPLDKDKEVANTHLGLTLGRLYERELAGSVKSDRTLRILLMSAPGFHKEVNELALKLAAFKPRASPDISETAGHIEDLRTLQDQQEALKEQMLDTQSLTWRQVDLYDQTLKLQAEDSLVTLKALAKVVQTDTLDSNIAKSRKEIDRIATSESLNRDNRLEAWKTLLGTLEELKRGTFPSLQKTTIETATGPADTLRKQALEDSIHLSMEALLKGITFSKDLNALGGDEDTKRSIEGIAQVLDPAKASKSPDFLHTLLSSWGSLGSIQLHLLDNLRSGSGGQKVNDTLTVTQELVPQVKEITSQLLESSSDSTGETNFDDPFGLETTDRPQNSSMTLSEGVADARKGVALMGNLVKKVVESRAEMKETREQLDPVTREMRLLAEEMASSLPGSKPALQRLPISPASSRTSDAITWLGLYLPFLRTLVQDLSKGKFPSAIVQEAMKILQPAQEELKKVTGEIAQQRPEVAVQLQGLDTEAEACFQDYRTTKKDTNLLRGLYTLKAYFPLIRDMWRGIGEKQSSVTSSGQVQPTNSLSDTAEELQLAISELSSVTRDLSPGNMEITEQLALLEGKSPAISAAGPTKSDILRLIRLLRGYPQLLRDIDRSNGGPALLRSLKDSLNDTHREAMEKAEGVPSPDISKLHTEAESLLSEQNTDPIAGKMGKGLALLRAYIPLFLNLRDLAIAKELDRVTGEARQVAEDMGTNEDKERLIAIQREAAQVLDKRPNFTAIRKYVPLIGELWRRKAAGPITHPAIEETVAMLEANSAKLRSLKPPIEPSLQVFSEELDAPLEAYRASASPEDLIRAVKVFGPRVEQLIDQSAKRYGRLATSEEPSGWTEAVETFEPVFDEADSIATEIVNEDPETAPKIAPIREKVEEARKKMQTDPNKENFLLTVGWLQPYFTGLRQSVRGLGSNAAMRQLRSALQDAHREAQDLVDEESTEELTSLKDMVTNLFKNHSKTPSKHHLPKAVELLGKYRDFSQRQMSRGVWRVVKPCTEEIHAIAGKVAASEDQERLGNMRKAAWSGLQGPVNRVNLDRMWTALRDYFAFINAHWKGSQGETNAAIWPEVMNLLRGSLREVEGLGRVLSDSNPISLGKVRKMEENALVPFRDFETSPDSTHIPKTVKSIKAFYPLLQELAEALKSRPKAIPAGNISEGSSEATLGDTVEELKTTSEELHSLVTALSDNSLSPQVQVVAGAVTKSFTGFAKAPGNEAAMRIVKTLRGYHPLLQELSRNSGLKLVMDLLEVAANETHKEAAESVSPDSDLEKLREAWHRVFSAFKAAPKTQHIGEALEAIRAYNPFSRQVVWKSALKLLEPVVEDISLLAEELAEVESDRKAAAALKSAVNRPLTEAKQELKRHHFPQTVTSLAAYIPLLRSFAKARVPASELEEIMKVLTPSKQEVANIAANLASGDADSEAKVKEVSEAADTPFRDYQSTQKSQHIPKAATAIRSFYPLIQQLLGLRSRANEAADDNIAEAMRELEPAAKDVAALGRDIAEDDSAQVEIIENLHNSLESVLKEHKNAPKKEHIVRAIHAFRRYFPALREMLGKGNRFRHIMDLLEPILVETHKEAVEIAANDASLAPELQQLEKDSTNPFQEYRISYKRPQVHQALAALQAYPAFFRRFSWRYAVKQLGDLGDLVHITAEHLSSGVANSRDTLRELRQESTSAITEHRTAPKLSHIRRLTTALAAYMPFLKTLSSSSGLTPARTEEDQPNFSVTEAMEALEPHQKELESLAGLLSAGETTYQARLHSLRTESLRPLEEYKQSPQYIYLPRAIKALYEYHPLLKELASKRNDSVTDSDSEREAVMHELEQHAAEVNELLDEIAEGEAEVEDRTRSLKVAAQTPFKEHRNAPNRKFFLPAIKGIRAYHPVLMELARKMGIRSAMEALEPTVSSTHQMASDLASDDSDSALELHQLELEAHSPFKEFKKTPRRLYFHKALKALRDYHPFLRRYWWRRTMKHLETVVPEYDSLLVRRYPQLTGKVMGLRERLTAALKDYQSVYTPAKLAEGVEVLRAYHRLMTETIPEETKETVVPGTVRSTVKTAAPQAPVATTSQGLSPLSTKVSKVGAAQVSIPGVTTVQTVIPVSTKVAKISTTPMTVPTTTTSLDSNPVSTKVTKIVPIPVASPSSTLQTEDSKTSAVKVIPIGQPSQKLTQTKSSPNVALPSPKTGPRKLKAANPSSATFPKEEASNSSSSSKADDASPANPAPGTPSRPSLVLGRASVADLEQAEALLSSEKQEAVTHNLILQNLQSASVPTDKPLTYLNIFKFFEELMDAKFDVDSKDLKARRKPRGMTEFLMEHLNRQFGIKALAMKFLGQLVPGMQLLYNENIPYAVLFARLLQVFSPDPIPFQLAMFLTKVRVDFHRLMEKCSKEREKKAATVKKTKGAQPVTHGRAAYDLAATGGEAFTSDAMMLIYDLFQNDPESGELALDLLRPERVSHSDYVLYKVCHRMGKIGMNPEAVFNLIDADHGGSIDEEEFVQGIKSSLELWIPEAEIRSVHAELAMNGVLSKSAFLGKCSFDWYYSVVKSDDYITTKCQFLNVMIDVYARRVRHDTGMLIGLYESKNENPMTKDTLTNLLREMDPANTSERIEAIWSFGMEQAGDSPGLLPAPFVKAMLKYRSGQLAQTVFCKFHSDMPEIEKAIEDRKMETVDINLAEVSGKKGAAVTVKTTTTVKVATRPRGTSKH